MANQSAKKRREENEKHMRQLFYLIVGANAVYFLLRMVWMRASFGWRHWGGLALTSAAYKLTYDQLAHMAAPTFDEKRELIDGGYDMQMGGVCGYMHDIVYITAFVQLASIISDYFWLAYLVIPGFAIYKLWVLVIHPWIFESSDQGGEEDARTKKKREKAERKAARGGFVKVPRGKMH